MNIDELQAVFESYRDEDNAQKQKAYLKNQFEFLGLSKPIRAKLEKDFIKSTKSLSTEEIIKIVFELNEIGYREYLYTSQMVMQANFKKFSYDDVITLSKTTLTNQWWENTDGFQSFLKKWFKANPQYIESFVLQFYKDENMWMRRLAIISQLSMKEITSFKAMETAILYSITENEFFIQKAIGWALRDYSKVNPKVVREFIEENKNQMSNLAIREGSKYLD